MLVCNERDATIQRTISVAIKPTPTEIADAIWNLNDAEQVVLLGCLKRRFCNSEEGILQMEAVRKRLIRMPEEKSTNAKEFVRCLAEALEGDQLAKAKELLEWALHSDPEHDDLNEFDAKWAEAKQFIKEC